MPPLCTIITASLKFKICSQAMSSLFNFAARQTICNGLTIINAIWSFQNFFIFVNTKILHCHFNFSQKCLCSFILFYLKFHLIDEQSYSKYLRESSHCGGARHMPKNRVLLNKWNNLIGLTLTCLNKARGAFACNSVISSALGQLACVRFSVHIRRGLIAAF